MDSLTRILHTVRLTVIALAIGVVAGCGTDVRDVLGPEAGLEGSTSAVAGAQPSAPQGQVVHFGDFALYVPANVNHVRGILVTLGGPDTRGFAAGTRFGAPSPVLEASLQELGTMFRGLAEERGLAILGSGRFGFNAYPDAPASDQLLTEAIAQAAAMTGRTELLNAPIILYAISGGAPEAAGFTRRNPDRVSALVVRVPPTVGSFSGEALQVPVYMLLAEFDAFVNNVLLRTAFQAHRAMGAPWALAVEPGVVHHTLTPKQRTLTVNWMRSVLPLASANAFRQNPPVAGWLGDPATGAIAPAAAFVGDPSQTSWFPTRPLAAEWATFIGF